VVEQSNLILRKSAAVGHKQIGQPPQGIGATADLLARDCFLELVDHAAVGHHHDPLEER